MHSVRVVMSAQQRPQGWSAQCFRVSLFAFCLEKSSLQLPRISAPAPMELASKPLSPVGRGYALIVDLAEQSFQSLATGLDHLWPGERARAKTQTGEQPDALRVLKCLQVLGVVTIDSGTARGGGCSGTHDSRSEQLTGAAAPPVPTRGW